MKFGVREICDVVFRAKTKMTIGNKTFYRNEPVLYFDSLKTTTLEGAVTTVYANGGKGNARLMSWDGEKTVTFTMEDALISAESLAMLVDAEVIEANSNNTIAVHTTQRTNDTEYDASGNTFKVTIETDYKPMAKVNNEDALYVMILNNRNEIVSEPFVKHITIGEVTENQETGKNECTITILTGIDKNTIADIESGVTVLVDYYVARANNVKQIDIKPQSLGGNYYIEASTLFRNTDGYDLPAEFIIPNATIQSNFTFNMASTGDPSTFSFVMDAFPDYTRYSEKEKVFASIQIIEDESDQVTEEVRSNTSYSKTTAVSTGV